MSFSTALDIVQSAAGELGLPIPTDAAQSYLPLPRQLFALLNASGRQLTRDHEWGRLITLATITTVNGQAEYSLPADYSRMVDDTQWDATNHWTMIGPDTPQMARWRLTSIAANTGTRVTYTQTGTTKVTVWPVPTVAGNELTYLYVSKYWAAKADGTTQAQFLLDTDTSIFDPDLLIKEVKWRFMSAKGMGSALELRSECDIMKSQLIAADLGGGNLNMGPACERDGFDVVAGAEPNFILGEGGDYVEYD